MAHPFMPCGLARRSAQFAAVVAAALVLAASSAGAAAVSPYQIGLVFLDQSLDIPELPQVTFENNQWIVDSTYHPFTLTAASTMAVSQGGLAGWTESNVRSALRFRVEQAYRAVVPADPTFTLSVNIHLGPVPTTAAGRRLNVVIGTNDIVPANYGWSMERSAFDPLNHPNDSYVAAVFADNLDAVGAEVGGALNTTDKALNNLAGTIAHEIGHLFGLEHDPTGPAPPYSLMATGATGLTAAQRLSTRRFSAEHSAELLAALPITSRADFNMDGDVDVFQSGGQGDASILIANLGAGPWASLAQGDANSDGDVDVFQSGNQGDASFLISQLGAGSAPAFTPLLHASSFAADRGVPEPAGLVLAGIALGALAAQRRRAA